MTTKQYQAAFRQITYTRLKLWVLHGAQKQAYKADMAVQNQNPHVLKLPEPSC